MATKVARGEGGRFFLGVIREFLKKVAPRPSGVWTVAAKWPIWPPFYGASIVKLGRSGLAVEHVFVVLYTFCKLLNIRFGPFGLVFLR